MDFIEIAQVSSALTVEFFIEAAQYFSFPVNSSFQEK